MAQSLTYEITRSPSTVGVNTTSVTLRLRIWYNSNLAVIDSSNTFKVTGNWPNYSGSVSINVGNGGPPQLIYDKSITVSTSRSGTVSRSFSASLTGINFWGAGQTITTSGTHTVPKRPPDRPSKPATPTVDNITSSSFRVNRGSAPANNGASITNWQVQIATNTGFSSGVVSQSGTGTTFTFTGRTRNTTYYARTRCQNSAGWSDWSNARRVDTLPTVPDRPVAPTVSNITPTSAKVSFTAPNNGGAAINRFTVQVATNTGFTQNLKTVNISRSTSGSTTITGLIPGSTYYARVLARNSVGESTYSPNRTFDTLSGAYIYNGSAWVPATVRIYNGSAWVDAEVRRYNGSAWVVTG